MRIVLIDCENLTGARRRALAFRWRGFDRVELFGRAALMAPWRAALAAEGLVVAAEWPVAADAPPQAADDLIAGRAAALAPERPLLVAIASNDRGFAVALGRLAAAGIPAEQHRDPAPAELLRLVVAARAREGWAEAAEIGTVLAERFGLSLRGRLDQLAAKAGVAVARGPGGVRLGIQPARAGIAGSAIESRGEFR